MKRLQILACCLFASLALAQPTNQTPAADPQISQLVAELRAQQELITANQSKIEERLVAIAEAVRVARIYSSRSGN